MYVTEEEAKAKLCPGRAQADDLLCIASGCMGWRWEDQIVWAQKIERARYDHPSMSVEEIMELIPRTGFCGMAGAPLRQD